MFNLSNLNIPFKNIPNGTSSTSAEAERLVLFLEKYLPFFQEESHMIETKSEEDISEELWSFLTRICMTYSYPYAFKPEKKQKKENKKGHSRRVDFGIFYVSDLEMDLFYTLEAKKLPTEKIGHHREKEYVTGNYGAIKRFKDEKHGLDKDGYLLQRNGIIAYVTENTFEHWHTKINSWIDESNWNVNEQLNKVYFNKIAKLSSTHIQESMTYLYLDHFWIRI